MSGETILESIPIETVGEANAIFGGKGCTRGSQKVPIVLMPGRRSCCPYITAPSGMYALVQEAGRDANAPTGKAVWPGGFHWASPFPWNQRRISHLVTKQSVVFDTPIRGCKTMDDVTVTIDICVVFRIMGDKKKGEDPELVRTFVHKLGASELARQLKDAQDERVRALARSVRHTEVYALRSHGSHSGDAKQVLAAEAATRAHRFEGKTVDNDGDGVELSAMGNATDSSIADGMSRKTNEKAMRVTEDMKIKLNQQFNSYGVQIIDVAIQKVSLPKNFADQMEQRTTYGAEIEQQKQKQMKDMQAVKQREELETLQQRYAEEQALERESGKKMQAVVEMKLQEVVAETNKSIQNINEQCKADVLEVKSSADLEVQKFESQSNKTLQDWKAKAAAAREKIISDADAYCWKKASEAKLVEVQNSALGNKVKAQAEGQAAIALRGKRAFILQKEQIAMYSALADNKDVVITGKNAGQGMLADLVMSQKQSNILLNVDNSSMRR